MAQFDVFANSNPAAKNSTPYLVALQSDYLEDHATVIVAPLVRRAPSGLGVSLRAPVLINGETFVVVFEALAAISKHALGKPVGAAPELRDILPRAIDRMFLGL